MNTRILATAPLLALRENLAVDTTPIAHHTINQLLNVPSPYTTDTIHLLVDVPDHILHMRLTTCLEIIQPALVILSPTAQSVTHTSCLDGTVCIVPTRTPSFAHIARTRTLPPHEYERRIQLLKHPQLHDCIALAKTHGSISRTLIADHLHITTATATTLLKQLTPLFYPTDATAKHFVYDPIAHRAVTLYPIEGTFIEMPSDPRHHLPEVVRRYANHLGKIRQLPVRLSDRAIVLRYLAQQLPITPMSESEINAAILAHVAFDDYATARRDMVDLGVVMRTATGSVYQRIDDVSN